jgi:hypothetical protein
VTCPAPGSRCPRRATAEQGSRPAPLLFPRPPSKVR